jgi:hypothetical protein
MLNAVSARIFMLGVSDTTRLENMNVSGKHALATIIKAGSSNQSYESAINIICESSEALKREFFDDPVIQRKLIKGIVAGTVINEQIISNLKTCRCDLDISTQTQIMNHISQETLQSLLKLPDVNSILFRFFTTFLCEERLLNAKRDMLAAMENAATLDQAKAEIAVTIDSIVFDNHAENVIYSTKTTQDILIAKGNAATSDEARAAIAREIRSIAMNHAGQIIFSTESARNMLIAMGNAATSDQARESIAWAIRSIAMNPAGRAIFSTEPTRDCSLRWGIALLWIRPEQRLLG